MCLALNKYGLFSRFYAIFLRTVSCFLAAILTHSLTHSVLHLVDKCVGVSGVNRDRPFESLHLVGSGLLCCFRVTSRGSHRTDNGLTGLCCAPVRQEKTGWQRQMPHRGCQPRLLLSWALSVCL